MKRNTSNKKELVKYRMERARITLDDARKLFSQDILPTVTNCAFAQWGFGGLKPCLSSLKSAKAD